MQEKSPKIFRKVKKGVYLQAKISKNNNKHHNKQNAKQRNCKVYCSCMFSAQNFSLIRLSQFAIAQPLPSHTLSPVAAYGAAPRLGRSNLQLNTFLQSIKIHINYRY